MLALLNKCYCIIKFEYPFSMQLNKMHFLNDEPGMVRPTLIDLNPVELKYYPLKISLDKFTESCNVLSPKRCVPKETKGINVTATNMIKNKSEAKTLTKYISCDCKYKFNSTICNSNKNCNNKTCQCKYKSYKCKKDYSWIPSICICENSKCLKSISDTSITDCDYIITVMDIVSTTTTNTIYSNKCYEYCFNKLS